MTTQREPLGVMYSRVTLMPDGSQQVEIFDMRSVWGPLCQRLLEKHPVSRIVFLSPEQAEAAADVVGPFVMLLED
jgi:hypothetical protein